MTTRRKTARGKTRVPGAFPAAASNGKLLTADEILASDDRKTIDVAVPEWGGTVRLRALSGNGFADYAKLCAERAKDSQDAYRMVRETLFHLSAVNDDGSPLFTEDQLQRLGDKSTACLDRCFQAAQRLNALSKAQARELAGN